MYGKALIHLVLLLWSEAGYAVEVIGRAEGLWAPRAELRRENSLQGGARVIYADEATPAEA